MAKIRIDLPPDPEDWLFLATCHSWRTGEPFYEYHTVWVYTLDELQHLIGYPGWILWMPPAVTGPAPWYPVWDSAWDLAHYLLENPDIIADRCVYCHYLEMRGSYPRFNLPQGERYPYRIPACLSTDDHWHW